MKALPAFMVGVAITAILFTAFMQPQQGAPAQQLVIQPKPAPTLERFRAFGASTTSEVYFLVVNAGEQTLLRIWRTKRFPSLTGPLVAVEAATT